MKKYTTRVICLSLAAALAAGTCLPALAEGASLSKDENVYAVMNSDGTIQSTTVSDHLYSAGGLSTVTDNSSLTDIQNTQGEATFTQNGAALTWNTDDTDVYYKGTSPADPPVTASIRYTLDGTAATAEELAGKSGKLVMDIALTNHETGTVETKNGGTRQVVTPFVAVVGAILNGSFSNISAEHGIVQGDGGSQVVGFACLPGVKACVSDLLGDNLSDVDQYLLDNVTITADVTDFEVPSVMIACATDTSLLGESGDLPGFEDMGSLDDLQADMDKLTDAMDQLTDGAAKLDDGATKLDNGATDLNTGAAKLDNGAADLKSGAAKVDNGVSDLKSGAAKLDNGAGDLKSGTITLKEGADQLAGGVATLKDGTSQLRSGSASLKTGAADLNTGLATLSSGLNTLVSKSDALNNGAKQIADAVLATANSQLKANKAISEDMTWENYAAVLSAALGVNDTMRAAAKQKLADTVKAKTGSDLTADQLNALIYLTAVSMGSNPSQALDTAVAAVGANMTAAAAYAPTVAAAQQALAAAGSNPVAVPAVLAVLETLSANEILAGLTQKGVPADQASLVLVAAALAGGDLTQGLNAVAQQLAAAKPALTAQAALAAAGNNPTAVPAVQSLLSALAGSQTLAEGSAAVTGSEAATPEEAAATDEDAAEALAADPIATAYAALCAKISQATGVADPAKLALLVTTIAVSGSTELTTAIPAAATAAQVAESLAAPVAAAKSALAAAGGTVTAVPAVKTALDNGFAAQAYTTLAGKTGVTDAATNALLITAAAQAMAAGTTTDITAALQAAGASLQNANTVNNAMTVANNGDDAAASLMTAFLTSVVSTASSDSLKQIESLNNSLAQVQGFVAGLQQYTAGVAQAAAGAATAYTGSTKLADGASTLADGAAKADDGTGTLQSGIGTLVEGVAKLKDGTLTLKDGTSSLVSGASTLKDGTAALADGTGTLKTGTGDLKSGTTTLKNGTTDLKKGTTDLKTGVNKLNSEGISKLTDSIDADQLQTLKDVLTAMKDRQTGYKSFTGAPDGAAVSVRFVLKTAEVTKAATAESSTTVAAPKMNLWQRILNLFGLYKAE